MLHYVYNTNGGEHVTISWIYARNTDWLIGDKNRLPWKSKTDMEHFRTRHMVMLVMGRKTFESIVKM